MCVIHKVFIFCFPGKEHSWYFIIIYMLIYPMAHLFILCVYHLLSLMSITCDIMEHHIYIYIYKELANFANTIKSTFPSIGMAIIMMRCSWDSFSNWQFLCWQDGIFLLNPTELSQAYSLLWKFLLNNDDNSWTGVTVFYTKMTPKLPKPFTGE